MKKSLKFLLVFYVILILAKILLVTLIPMSTAFSDDYQYLKMGRSFFFDHKFNVHGIDNIQFSPLYPILISISYIFKDSIYVYFAIKIVNLLLSSLIIIPAYLLAKEFLSEKNSRILTFIIALLPTGFSYNSYILTENLFYPLFLFSIYFIYRCLIYDKKFDIILAGLFTGLALLTRIHGIIILATLGILFVLDLFRKKINYKLILISLIAVVLYSPWLIRNLIIFNSLPNTYSGNLYALEASNIVSRGSIFYSIYPFIAWLITYSGALFLSSLVIFPLFLFYKSKDNKLNKFRLLSFISIIVTLLIAVNHHLRGEKYFYKLSDWIFFSGKLIGRYIDFLIPLILIIGFIGLINYKNNLNKDNKKLLNISILSIVIISSVHFISRSLFLPNNPSLTWIGIIKQIIDYIFYSKNLFYVDNSVMPMVSLASLIIIPLLLTLIIIFITKFFIKLRLSKILILIILFLLSINLINVGVSSYNAKTWYETPQVQLSLWLNNYDKDKISNILIDQRDFGDLKKDNQKMLYVNAEKSKYTIIGHWLNDNIFIDDVNKLKNIDYIISRDKNLGFNIIKKSENGIYIYKVK
ncbi:MAG: glycosyltransferase family 39 protein [Nanoarchaeota archaeon]